MFQLTPNSVLDSFCMMAVYILAIYNYICMKDKRKGTGYFFLVVFITLFSLLYRPEGGDFWNYLGSYQLGVGNPYHHMEEFYYWLMSFVPHNYLLWRILIWLPAAIIIVITFKLLKTPSNIATVFFLLLALTNSYYYTRNALALSVLYLALALYCLRDTFTRRSLNTILSIGLVFASWFLHKSMPVYILLAIFAALLPFNKRYFIASLVAFPLLYGAIMILSSDFINIAELWIVEGAGENYLEAENAFSANWKGIISLIIGYLPIVYFYIIAFRHPLPSKHPDFYPYKVFFLFSFFLVFVSFLFLGQGGMAIQSRLYKSSMLPMTFVVGLYFKNFNGTKYCNYFIYLLMLKIVVSFLTGSLSDI